MGRLGRSKEAAEVLLALAREQHLRLRFRREATLALGQIGRVDETILAGLLRLARDPQAGAKVSRAVTQALGELSHANERVLDDLLTLAQDPSIVLLCQFNLGQN